MPYVIRPKHLRASLAAVFGALALALVAAPGAQAACAGSPTTKAFASFGDSADYALAPAGSFESGATGWTLERAGVVRTNEPFKVHGAGDAASLAIMPGGRAASPAFCVGAEHPSFRLFALRVGRSGVLNVRVRWTADDGTTKEKAVGTISGSGTWAPSESFSLAPSMGVFDDKTVDAQIVLEPTGSGAGWLVDDLYVDPYTRG